MTRRKRGQEELVVPGIISCGRDSHLIKIQDRESHKKSVGEKG